MFKNRKVVRGIILAVLLLCTAYLVYSIIANPLGEQDRKSTRLNSSHVT